MHIRKATYGDLDRLMEIFENAKAIMRSCVNLQQWNNGYPRDAYYRSISRPDDAHPLNPEPSSTTS